MITLTDPLSIIATLCNLSPGEHVIVWPLPQIAYVLSEPMTPQSAENYADGRMLGIELHAADDPPIDYDTIRAVDVYIQREGGWLKVKGRGAYE